MPKDSEKVRGIYLLPNLFTTGALFAAFYAIIAAMQGNFVIASQVIFIALIADALDGRVARMTNTATDFGGEYDSLADMVSFGLAPSLILYAYALHNFGKIGWLISFAYTAAVALRLARFNTQIGVANKAFFQGLPCPPAAAIVAGLVWNCEIYGRPGDWFNVVIAVIAVILSILMVSNVRYRSFKEMDVKGRVPFFAVVVIVLAFVLISLGPSLVLFAAFSLFGLSGPVMTLLRIRGKRVIRKKIQKIRREKESVKD